MTDKDLLLSKIYNDNTVCFWVNDTYTWVSRENKHIADSFIKEKNFYLSTKRILKFFKNQNIEVLTGILEDHLKLMGINTYRRYTLE